MRQDIDSPRRGLRAAVTSAAVIGAMFSGGFATAAIAHAQDPKPCVDATDADGCPHDGKGPDGNVWVADQFHLIWDDPQGAAYYVRNDGWAPDSREASDLARNLGFKSGAVWDKNYVRLTGR